MINPHLTWLKPQPLNSYPYQPVLADIPQTGGVYFFYRKHGDSFEVFYVGKASNLRGRVKSQLNNLKLMNGIHNAANGSRFLAYAEVSFRQGQQEKPTIHAAEKIMIRHFVDEGHQLLNIQGKKISVQVLTSKRPTALNKLVPLRTQIEA
jgi:hypothetical protein